MTICSLFKEEEASRYCEYGYCLDLSFGFIQWPFALCHFQYDHVSVSIYVYFDTIWSYEILLFDFGILLRAINKSGNAKETSTGRNWVCGEMLAMRWKCWQWGKIEWKIFSCTVKLCIIFGLLILKFQEIQPSPEGCGALVERVVPLKVWDHDSILARLLCRIHLEYNL